MFLNSRSTLTPMHSSGQLEFHQITQGIKYRRITLTRLSSARHQTPFQDMGIILKLLMAIFPQMPTEHSRQPPNQ